MYLRKVHFEKTAESTPAVAGFHPRAAVPVVVHILDLVLDFRESVAMLYSVLLLPVCDDASVICSVFKTTNKFPIFIVLLTSMRFLKT